MSTDLGDEGRPAPPLPQAFRSAEGRFTVDFPGLPEEGRQVVNTPIGPIPASSFAAQGPEGALAVVYCDYPGPILRGSTPDHVLSGACNGMVINLMGMILSSKSLAQSGCPGKEIEYEFLTPITSVKGFGKARVFLVRDRLYQVFVVGSEGKVRSEETTRFLESFRFDAVPPPSGTEGPHPVGPLSTDPFRRPTA